MKNITITTFTYKGIKCSVKKIHYKRAEFKAMLNQIKLYKGEETVLDIGEASSWYCGYIYLDKNHPIYNKYYLNFDTDILKTIHGGITYYDKDQFISIIGMHTNHAFDNKRTRTIGYVKQNLRDVIDIMEKKKCL